MRTATLIGIGLIAGGAGLTLYAVFTYSNQGFLSFLLGGEFKNLPVLLLGFALMITGAIFIFGLGQSSRAFAHVSSRSIESGGRAVHYAVTG
jgi:hypothetical protein